MPTGAYSSFYEFIPKEEVNTIFELGSRDGLDAIDLQNHFDAKVIAWECNPSAIEICKKNLQGHSNIELIEKAVWSSNKTITFRPVINGNTGASSVFEANSDYPYEIPYEQDLIEVPAVRIDDHWQGPIDLLAIDLQGSELEALKGMGKLLNDVKYIITEGQYKRLYHDTPLISDIAEYLSEFGFVLQHKKDVNDWFGDFFFSKNI